MLTGRVNVRLEAVLPLTVRGPNGATTVEAVIDTGYTGTLTLPVAVAATLGLSTHRSGGARLADGSVRQFDIFSGEVEWCGVCGADLRNRNRTPRRRQTPGRPHASDDCHPRRGGRNHR